MSSPLGKLDFGMKLYKVWTFKWALSKTAMSDLYLVFSCTVTVVDWTFWRLTLPLLVNKLLSTPLFVHAVYSPPPPRPSPPPRTTVFHPMHTLMSAYQNVCIPSIPECPPTCLFSSIDEGNSFAHWVGESVSACLWESVNQPVSQSANQLVSRLVS